MAMGAPALFNDTDGEIDEHLTQIAAKMAQQLVPVQQVGEAAGLSNDEIVALLDNEDFQQRLIQEKAKWLSPENAPERIRIKGLLGVEDAMLYMTSILQDPDINPMVRIKAFSEYIRIAGADNVATNKVAKHGGSDAEGFSVAIHIGGDVHQLAATTVAPATLPHTDSVESSEDEGFSLW